MRKQELSVFYVVKLTLVWAVIAFLWLGCLTPLILGVVYFFSGIVNGDSTHFIAGLLPMAVSVWGLYLFSGALKEKLERARHRSKYRALNNERGSV